MRGAVSGARRYTYTTNRGAVNRRIRGRSYPVLLALVALVIGGLLPSASAAAAVGGAPAPAGFAAVAPGSIKTIVRDGTLASSGQNMFGPGQSERLDLPMFDLGFDESGSFDEVESGCIDFGVDTYCADFGLGASASVSGSVSMSLGLEGVDSGSISVTYPVTVTFTAPADNSFGPGDTVDITTSMEVDAANATLVANFPQLDSISVSGGVAAAADVTARACFFDCTSGELFPPFDFDVSGQFLDVPASLLDLGCAGFLVSFPLGFGTNSQASKCGGGAFVFNPDVEAPSVFHPDGTISASGSDQYANIPVSLITWLGRLAGLPLYLQLNPNIRFQGIEVGWTTFNTIISALETMEQDLLFNPRVDINLDWGSSLPFQVIDGTSGAVLGGGDGEDTTLTIGDTLRLTTSSLNSKVTPISPTLVMGSSSITNSTRSVTSGNVDLSALGVQFTVPAYEFCDPFGIFGCGNIWDRTSESFGPLYTQAFPLGAAAKSIYNGTFELGGFAGVPLDSFDLVPLPVVEIRKKVMPANAEGSFDLILNDVVKVADAVDGSTTGQMVLEPGDWVISETGARMHYFEASTECVARDGGQVHTAGSGTTTVTLVGGENLICTVENRLPVPAECDSMSFDSIILGTPNSDQVDRLVGTSGNDIIVGYGGNDMISAGGGDDCVSGNEGDDRISLGSGNNVGDGGPGHDQIAGGTGVNICFAEETRFC